MKFRFLSAFCAALITAAPAYAQSSFVMVIGPVAASSVAPAATPATDAQLVEDAAERACGTVFIRDLKGQVLRDQCLVEARAEAQAILDARRGGQQLAAR